jgi:hypothetical protein
VHALALAPDHELLGHARHAAAAAAEYVPAPHACLAPPLQKNPFSQGTHMDDDVAPAAGVYWPSGHAIGLVMSVVLQYEPAGHVVTTNLSQ